MYHNAEKSCLDLQGASYLATTPTKHLSSEPTEFVYRVGILSPAMGRGIDSRNRVWNWVAKLQRLAGRYENPMHTWFLAPIAGLKLPAQEGKLMPENFPAGQFLRKADKCFGVGIVK